MSEKETKRKQEEKKAVSPTPIVVPIYQEQQKEKKKKMLGKWKANKQAKKSQKKQKKEKKPVVLRQTKELLPFLQLHDEYIVTKYGVMDILQIQTKDIYSMNPDDLKILLYSEARAYRSNAEAIKIIGLNFPSNTQRQQTYWRKKQAQTEDPLRLQFIEQKLIELDFLEKSRTNREFFRFLYAKTPEQLENQKNLIIRSAQQSFRLETIDKKKKQDILFLLLNQNSKL